MSPEISPAPALSRVKSIATKRLFGLYDHTVSLSLEHRVTIIHGANGVGKTVLLKLVHALFSQDFAFLLSIPYEELLVTLSDETTIRVKQARLVPQQAGKVEDKAIVTVADITAAPNGGVESIRFVVRSDQIDFESWAQQLEGVTSWLHSMGPNRYVDIRTNTTMTAVELWRAHASESQERIASPMQVEVPKDLIAEFSKVTTHLVEAQRLMRFAARNARNRHSDVSAFIPAVMADAQELAQKLRDAFSQYGRASQKLDQSFPRRLFETSPTMSADEIKHVLVNIEKDQSKLASLGILDIPTTYQFPQRILETDAAKRDAMELFVNDSREKLKPLVDFASRVEPLLTNINSKFKNKSVRLDKDKGMVARAADNSEIKADQLSSGEQHEIVLLYFLLFRVSKNALVMIDEPELSLHIDWQRKFLPELLQIAAQAQIDALVATHSPSIVGEREDLMIVLDSRPD